MQLSETEQRELNTIKSMFQEAKKDYDVIEHKNYPGTIQAAFYYTAVPTVEFLLQLIDKAYESHI